MADQKFTLNGLNIIVKGPIEVKFENGNMIFQAYNNIPNENDCDPLPQTQSKYEKYIHWSVKCENPNKRIFAIKTVRECLGYNLAEAKAIVDGKTLSNVSSYNLTQLDKSLKEIDCELVPTFP